MKPQEPGSRPVTRSSERQTLPPPVILATGAQNPCFSPYFLAYHVYFIGHLFSLISYLEVFPSVFYLDEILIFQSKSFAIKRFRLCHRN